MGTAERRERERQQKRNDIINAAEELFFSKGYNHTSMDEVAEKAEFSKGTLYLYFKNKEDLYMAINHRGLLILKGMFEKAFAKGKNGLEKSRAIGETYLQFSREYPNYYSAMLYYESNDINFSIDESSALECEEMGQRVLGIVAKAIEVGIKDGTINPELDPMYTATILWAQTSGMINIMSLRGKHLEVSHGINFDKMLQLSFDMQTRSLKS